MLIISFQLKNEGDVQVQFDKTIQTAQLPTNKQIVEKTENKLVNQLSEMFFLPNQDVSNFIKPACNGNFSPFELNDKEEKLDNNSKNKSSTILIKPFFPYDPSNKNYDPSNKNIECNNVTNQIFKK